MCSKMILVGSNFSSTLTSFPLISVPSFTSLTTGLFSGFAKELNDKNVIKTAIRAFNEEFLKFKMWLKYIYYAFFTF